MTSETVAVIRPGWHIVAEVNNLQARYLYVLIGYVPITFNFGVHPPGVYDCVDQAMIIRVPSLQYLRDQNLVIVHH
jgi:hypothetical protein